jgi:hypothetical protein
MPQILWAPTVASIDAELASATGADLAVGTKIRATLNAAGTTYDARYDDAGVAAAKTAWLSAAELVHDDADHAARYAESLVASADPALTFDPYSSAAIIGRLANATKATLSATVRAFLSAHTSAVSTVYAGPASAAIYFAPITRTVLAPSISKDVLRDAALTSGNTQAFKALAAKAGVTVEQLTEAVAAIAENRSPRARTIVDSPGVRSLELDLIAALAEANAWLALIAF